MENPPRLFLVSHSQGYGEGCIRKRPPRLCSFLLHRKVELIERYAVGGEEHTGSGFVLPATKMGFNPYLGCQIVIYVCL